MAQSDQPAQEPVTATDHAANLQSLWRRLFGKDNGGTAPADASSKPASKQEEDPRPGLIRRVSRKVVPGLPRAQTFKRQQSELRSKLEPVQQTHAERRTVSVDRRLQASQNGSLTQSNPRSSAPDFVDSSFGVAPSLPSASSLQTSAVEERQDKLPDPADQIEPRISDLPHVPDAVSTLDALSMTTSQYDAMIHDELERVWILNLSMHFRDKSKREKFFVTYRERPTVWRRVTISLDYRHAPEGSLEWDLAHTKLQRDKSAKIYEAIRESLVDIKFYDTVTNLKLQTTDGRLHVHVVEDVTEIIHYPSVRMIQHMRCNRVKEGDIEFDSHMSGFVYKVRVNDEVLIKKEIPGPDTVDEFLYEINALNRLKHSHSVIKFHGVIVDDRHEYVKGLLISYAEQGALIDVIYDNEHSLPWPRRERWARQIIQGLSEIHEAGFVQGDFTLSNIVVDGEDNAKIIDINRRGCPVGWEPPEATPLIENNQRISMYIGVKSDLYQLGMVLWALATQEDEPEAHGRPLRIGPDPLVPPWYRRIIEICLSEDPRMRIQALHLLSLMPEPETHETASRLGAQYSQQSLPSISVDDDVCKHEFPADGYRSPYSWVQPVRPPTDWSYVSWGPSFVNTATGVTDDPYFYPTRGRSPPSPLPSTHSDFQGHEYRRTWPVSYDNSQTALSVDETVPGEIEEIRKSVTPRTSQDSTPPARKPAETERSSTTDQAGGTDGRVEDYVGEDPQALCEEAVAVDGRAESDAEDDGGPLSENMATPVQKSGKPCDAVADGILIYESETVGKLDPEKATLELSGSGNTEPENPPLRSEGISPSHDGQPDVDPHLNPDADPAPELGLQNLVPASEADKTAPGLSIANIRSQASAQHLVPGVQAERMMEVEIDGGTDDEAGELLEEVATEYPTDLWVQTTSPELVESKPNPIREDIPEDLKRMSSAYDPTSVQWQESHTGDDTWRLLADHRHGF